MFSVLHKYADGTESVIGEIREVSKIISLERQGPKPLFDVMIVPNQGDAILVPIGSDGEVRQKPIVDPAIIVMNEHGRTVATYWL